MRRGLLTVLTVGLLPLGAAVIDFNSVPSSGNPIQSPSLTTQGFVFTSAHFHTVDSPGTCGFGGCVTNGTIYLAVDGPALGFPIVMTASGGGAFSLNAFDGDKLFLDDAAAMGGGFPNATSIGLLASVNGGGSLSTSFLLNGTSSFQHFTLPGSWTNLLSVTFTGVTGATTDTSFALDNITVNTVPEPSTFCLLGIGIALLGFRKKAVVLRRSVARQ
jgi:hypothetical protein